MDLENIFWFWFAWLLIFWFLKLKCLYNLQSCPSEKFDQNKLWICLYFSGWTFYAFLYFMLASAWLYCIPSDFKPLSLNISFHPQWIQLQVNLRIKNSDSLSFEALIRAPTRIKRCWKNERRKGGCVRSHNNKSTDGVRDSSDTIRAGLIGKLSIVHSLARLFSSFTCQITPNVVVVSL